MITKGCFSSRCIVILLALMAIGSSSSLAETLSLSKSIASDSSISRESREILDLLYPATPPSDTAKEFMRRVLLAFHLHGALEEMKSGSFVRASELLAESIHGVDWRFSPLELIKVLDGYEAPKEEELPLSRALSDELRPVREQYRQLRGAPLRELLEQGDGISFARLHVWVTNGDGVLSSFLAARGNILLSWEELSQSELADLDFLLKGAKEAENPLSTAGLARSRENLSRSYLRERLELFVVFDELRRAAELLSNRFRGFLKGSKLSFPLRILSLQAGKAVEGAMVSFGNGMLGNEETDSQGRVYFDKTLYKLGRLLQGDGWTPLSIYKQRVELLYTNLSVNDLLAAARVHVSEEGTNAKFELPSRTLRVSRGEKSISVKVVCDKADGMLGKICSCVIKLSGQEPIKTVLNEEHVFERLYCGDYLLSVEGKDEMGVTQKTAAKSLSIGEDEAHKSMSIELPSSEVEEVKNAKDLAAVKRAFEENKERLLKNELEEDEYRKVQGLLFKNNRKSLGRSGMREAMNTLRKISIGLKYKSEGLHFLERIEELEREFENLRKELPVKIMEGSDLRGNLLELVERYSSENFELDSSDEYLFLARYRHFLERAQSNHQELILTFETLDKDIRPKVAKLKKRVNELISEYCKNYQLVKFTQEYGRDKEFHELLVEDLLPFERLLEKVEQLESNDFLDSYHAQVRQLERVVENRHATLKKFLSNLEQRLEKYKDYARRKLHPIEEKINFLQEKGVELQRLDRLADLKHLADPKARVVRSQQSSFFSILEALAAEDALEIPDGSLGPRSLKGHVAKCISDLLPALEFNGRVARNQARAKELKDQYNALLRRNLFELYDITTPEEKIRKLFAKDSYERKREVNSATGELARERSAPDLLLEDVPKRSKEVYDVSKDLLALYISDLRRRRERDGNIVDRADDISEILLDLKGNDEAKLSPLLRSLRALSKLCAPPKRGGLLFPRLEGDRGKKAEERLSEIERSLSMLVSKRYGEISKRCAELAEVVNPMNIKGAPPEKEMAQARALLESGPSPALEELAEVMKELDFSVGKACQLWNANSQRLKEYLVQLGVY